MSVTCQPEQSLFSSFVNPPSDPSSLISKKINYRLGTFTNEMDYTEIKTEKMEDDIDLGSQERAKLFRNKRMMASIPFQYMLPLQSVLQIDRDKFEAIKGFRVNPTELLTYSNLLLNPTIEEQYTGLVALTKLISIEKPQYQDIFDSGVVPIIKDFLVSPVSELVYQSLVFLTNLSFGDIKDISEITSQDGLIRVIACLDSRIEEIESQAIWLLGNLMEKREIRNELKRQKVYDKLTVILSTTESDNVAKQSIWTLNQYIKKEKTSLPYMKVSPLLPSLVRWIFKAQNNDKLIENALSLLTLIQESFREATPFLVNTNILPQLMTILSSNDKRIVLLGLRMFGNIILGNANETQIVIDIGLLSYLKMTLKHECKAIRKETGWILSNISGGTQQQIEEIFKCGIYADILDQIHNDCHDVQYELFWAVCNLTSSFQHENIAKLLDGGIIHFIKQFIDNQKSTVVNLGLEALSNLLQYGQTYWRDEMGENMVVKMLEQCGLLDILEQLQYSPNQDTYEKVVELIRRFFPTTEEEAINVFN